MKKILIIVALTFFCNLGFSQTVSCQELKETIEENAKLESSTTCIGSSALVKAAYYTYEGNGFAIIYLKSNEYDFRGRPYVFCGISYSRWNKFISEGRYGSWGKAFSEYIRDYICNCN